MCSYPRPPDDMLNRQLSKENKRPRPDTIITAVLIVFAVTSLVLVAQAASANAWADATCSERKYWNATNISVMDDNVIDLTHGLEQDDLRFYAPDDTEKLPYWSENDNMAWIKASGHDHGYMYYNCTASETSGKQAFYLFDDFTAQNTTLWTEGIGVTYESGYVVVYGGGSWDTYTLTSNESFAIGKVFRASGYLNNLTATDFIGLKNVGMERFQTSGDNDIKYYSYDGVSDSLSAAYGKDPRTEMAFEIRWLNTSYCNFTVDGVSKTELVDVETGVLPVVFDANTGVIKMDWIFIHNFTDAFQSAAFGSEEAYGGATPNTHDFTVTLASPADQTLNESLTVSFAFSVNLQNTTLINCSLWTNETSWSDKEINTTAVANGTSTYISETFSADGSYLWNIECWNGTEAKFASANRSFSIDSTGDPNADFVTPTLGNASYTSSADWIYVNVSSDETLAECILNIDGHNYSMTTTGQYCSLNFTNLGYSGSIPGDDYQAIWYKDPDNPLNEFPAYTGEFSCHHGGLDGTIHCFYVDQYPAGGFCRANSTNGINFTLDNSGNEVITNNATSDEGMNEFPYHYVCTDPACEHPYYLFKGVKNSSDADVGQIRVMWSDDFYAPEGEWYRCNTPILTIGDSGIWRDAISANPAMAFNGTGWEGVIEMQDGSKFQMGSAYYTGTNPCGIWTWGNGDQPVLPAGSFTGSSGGTGNPWMDRFGFNADGTGRYIMMPGGNDGTDWKPYLFNASNLQDNSTYIQLEADPILDTINAYESSQTADIHCLSTPNEFNSTMCYYVSHDGNPTQSIATTNYSMNDIWGAGIQTAGELEFTVYIKDSSGNINSTSRTLDFGDAPDVTPPAWSGPASNVTNNTQWYLNMDVQFNMTWTDAVGVDTVRFDFNSHNTTVTDTDGDVYYTIMQFTQYNCNDYLWWADDAAGNMNNSDTYTYCSLCANNSLTLYLDGSTGNATIQSTDTFNITAYQTGEPGYTDNISIYVDGILIDYSGGAPTAENLSTWPAGTHEVTINTSGNNNYCANITTSSIWVTSVDLIIESPGNLTYTDTPININVTTTEDADWCVYNLDGGTNYTMLNDSMTNWFMDTELAIEDDQLLNIWCSDVPGNVFSNSTVWFTYLIPGAGGGGGGSDPDPLPDVCGNNICEDNETYLNCPSDCEAPPGDEEPEPIPGTGYDSLVRIVFLLLFVGVVILGLRFLAPARDRKNRKPRQVMK